MPENSIAPETTNGATYVTRVLVSLPPLAEVESAAEAFRSYVAAYREEQPFAPPGVPLTVTDLNGNDIGEPAEPKPVVYYRPNTPYVVLQSFVDNEDEGFDSLFGNHTGDGNFGFHQSYVSEAGVYVVPVEACDALEPVTAMAALCLGSEAMQFAERPEEGQVYALFAAAQIALGETASPPSAQ